MIVKYYRSFAPFFVDTLLGILACVISVHNSDPAVQDWIRRIYTVFLWLDLTAVFTVPFVSYMNRNPAQNY